MDETLKHIKSFQQHQKIMSSSIKPLALLHTGFNIEVEITSLTLETLAGRTKWHLHIFSHHWKCSKRMLLLHRGIQYAWTLNSWPWESLNIFARAVSNSPTESFMYWGWMVGFEGDYGIAPFESSVRGFYCGVWKASQSWKFHVHTQKRQIV